MRTRTRRRRRTEEETRLANARVGKFLISIQSAANSARTGAWSSRFGASLADEQGKDSELLAAIRRAPSSSPPSKRERPEPLAKSSRQNARYESHEAREVNGRKTVESRCLARRVLSWTFFHQTYLREEIEFFPNSTLLAFDGSCSPCLSSELVVAFLRVSSRYASKTCSITTCTCAARSLFKKRAQISPRATHRARDELRHKGRDLSGKEMVSRSPSI